MLSCTGQQYFSHLRKNWKNLIFQFFMQRQQTRFRLIVIAMKNKINKIAFATITNKVVVFKLSYIYKKTQIHCINVGVTKSYSIYNKWKIWFHYSNFIKQHFGMVEMWLQLKLRLEFKTQLIQLSLKPVIDTFSISQEREEKTVKKLFWELEWAAATFFPHTIPFNFWATPRSG